MPTTRYTPDTFEQECICLLYKWLAENGFQNPDLPPIYLSFETPPMFAKISQDWHEIFADDMIWDNRDGDDKQKKEFDDKLKKHDLTREQICSIDGVLGLYHSRGHQDRASDNKYTDIPEIVLYAQGITAVAKRLNVPTEVLRAVVLVHEIGHWISHAVPDSNDQKWETDDFDCYSKAENPNNLLEMWAQLFPYWVAKEIQGLFKLTFEVLNTKESNPYKTFQQFTHHKKEDMLKVLIAFHRDTKKNDNSSEDFSTGYADFWYNNDTRLVGKLEKVGAMTKIAKNSGIH
ncbi:MAG: metallopeptidase family protein [Candidatus Kapaibacteriota bacterium]